MFGRSARIKDKSLCDFFSGATSTDQWLTIHFATSSDLTNHFTRQQLRKRKRDKVRERGIVFGEIEGYNDLKKESSFLL